MEEQYLWLGKFVYWGLFPLLALNNLWAYTSQRKRIYLIAAGICLILFVWRVSQYLRWY